MVGGLSELYDRLSLLMERVDPAARKGDGDRLDKEWAVGTRSIGMVCNE